MKTNSLKRICFGLMVIVQLAAPFYIMATYETILNQGVVYKFRTQPIDPYDAIRGRYIWLGVEPNSVDYSGTETFESGEKLFVTLSTDSLGFAVLVSASHDRPVAGDFLLLPINYHDAFNHTVFFQMPFERFFMNERKAPEAERLYWQHADRDKRDACVVVRVLDGQAVIDDLYVGGVSIMEAVGKE